METAFNASLVLLTVLHTLVLVAYARAFAHGPSGIAHLARPLLVTTIWAQIGMVAIRSAMERACPLRSWDEILAVVVFSICVTYLLLEVRIGVRSTGVFAMTPAFLLQLVAAVALLGENGAPRVTLDAFQSIHVFGAIIGFSAVALCGVYGLLYLFLYTAIKRGAFGLFYRRMPSLDGLSTLNYTATWLAFLALTLAIGLGFWSRDGVDGMLARLAHPSVILASLLWLLYGTSIFAWKCLGLGGKRLAYTTVLGLLFLIGIFCWGLVRHGFHA
jgi:ABC-type uncharacterized transport system permease subunit